jgi:hypothetical protein
MRRWPPQRSKRNPAFWRRSNVASRSGLQATSRHEWPRRSRLQKSSRNDRRAISIRQHTNKNGTVLRGGMTPNDIGVFQINEPVHRSALRQLGLDPHVLEHNVQFASYLKQRDGLWPWAMSAYCWDPAERHIAWKDWCAKQPACRGLAEKRGITLPGQFNQKAVLTAKLAL